MKVPETEVENVVPDVENQEQDIEELEPGTENQEPEIQLHESEVETAEVEVETSKPEVKPPQSEEEILKPKAVTLKLEIETPAVNVDDTKQPVEIPEDEKDKCELKKKLAEVDQSELVQPEVEVQKDKKSGKKISQEGDGSTYLSLANQSEETLAGTKVRKRRKSPKSGAKKSRETLAEKSLEESFKVAKRRTISGFKYDCCVII